MTELNSARYFITGLLLIALMLVELVCDIFVPCLPDIAHYFHVDQETAKLTVSLNLLGIAFSSLIYGPIADSWGRRNTLLLGTTILVLGVVLTIFSHSIELFLISRFISGFGGGAACVIALAGVSDLFDHKERPRVLAFTGMILAITPGVAPLLGGYLGYFLGWRGIFVFLAVVGILVLALLYAKMPEISLRKQKLNFASSLRQYRNILMNPDYVGYLLMYSFACSIIWVEASELPFVFTETFGMSEQYYGYYTVAGITGYMLAMVMNRYLLKFVKINQLIRVGMILLFAGFALILILSMMIPLTVTLIRGVLFISSIGLGFILSNTLSRAMSSAPETSGMASALVGPVEMSISAAIVTLVGEFYDATLTPFALTGMLTSIMCFVLLLSLRRRQHATALDKA